MLSHRVHENLILTDTLTNKSLTMCSDQPVPTDISLPHSLKCVANVISMWHWTVALSLFSSVSVGYTGIQPHQYTSDKLVLVPSLASPCLVFEIPKQTPICYLLLTVLSGPTWETREREEVWWFSKEIVTAAFSYPCKYLNTWKGPHKFGYFLVRKVSFHSPGTRSGSAFRGC